MLKFGLWILRSTWEKICLAGLPWEEKFNFEEERRWPVFQLEVFGTFRALACPV